MASIDTGYRAVALLSRIAPRRSTNIRKKANNTKATKSLDNFVSCRLRKTVSSRRLRPQQTLVGADVTGVATSCRWSSALPDRAIGSSRVDSTPYQMGH